MHISNHKRWQVPCPNHHCPCGGAANITKPSIRRAFGARLKAALCRRNNIYFCLSFGQVFFLVVFLSGVVGSLRKKHLFRLPPLKSSSSQLLQVCWLSVLSISGFSVCSCRFAKPAKKALCWVVAHNNIYKTGLGGCSVQILSHKR